jgi:subtilisin family serine protease
MALRAGYQRSDGEGLMPQSATVPAIYYAVFNGANILNMSYGGPGYSATAQAAMNYAWNNGAMLFAASGNEGLSSPPHYPAAYEHVIAVNMTDNNDVLDPYSNRGTWTDLCAPGSSPGIMSTSNNSNYASYEGTSMASPNAAGIAALIWGIFPYMTNEEVQTILFDTAIDITEENPEITPSHLGHGRVDAQRRWRLCIRE